MPVWKLLSLAVLIVQLWVMLVIMPAPNGTSATFQIFCGASNKAPFLLGSDNMKHYIAIDIGASSGRHIVGWNENEKIRTREVYRFPNGVTGRDGHLVWDIEALERHVKAGIDEALKLFPEIESLSIDTWGWGVDYVLLRGIILIIVYRPFRSARNHKLYFGFVKNAVHIDRFF